MKKRYYSFIDELDNVKLNNISNKRFFVNNGFDGRYYNIISNI